MSKYRSLSDRLQGHQGDEWRASFAEIEEVLGFPLPKSARAGKAWWTSGAWEGWQAHDVDHTSGAVTFRRNAAPPPDSEAGDDEAANLIAGAEAPDALTIPTPPAELAPLADVAPKRAVPIAALVAGGVAVVAGIGALVIRGLMRRR